MSEPAEDRECSSCGFETAELHSAAHHDPDGRELFFCTLCYSTLAGNAHHYPHLFAGDTATILKTICYVGNVVLEAIRKAKP